MAELVVLSEEEIEAVMDLDDLAAALEAALRSIALGEVSVPPRSAASTSRGLLAAMPGFVPHVGLGAKLVSVYPGNRVRGLSSHEAVIVLFDEETGAPCGLFGASYLTAVRTAMTAAVTARALHPEPSEVAVLGGGVQAAAHLDAFAHLFPATRLRLADRSRQAAVEIAAPRRRVEIFESFQAAVDGADVVCCTTDAETPILDDSWIRRGCHVSSVGSGREVPPATVDRADVFVESVAALLAPPAGTMELSGRERESVSEIGEVLAGRRPRPEEGSVTLYKSMGHAAEDLAASAVALASAKRSGVGRIVSI